MTSNFTFGFNRMVPASAAASWANAPAISRAPVSRAAVPVSRAPVPVSRAAVPVSRARAPVSRAPVSRAPAAAAANVPVTRSNRFSVTRLINFKSSGGCRSCN